MNKIFLGGTCNGSTWRDELIKSIQVDYFNPVVDDWTEECQAIEETQKESICNIHLYVITSDSIGVFPASEVIESAMTSGKISILHIIPTGMEKHQLKSWKAAADMVKKHGGIAYIDEDLYRTARVINNCFK